MGKEEQAMDGRGEGIFGGIMVYYGYHNLTVSRANDTMQALRNLVDREEELRQEKKGAKIA